MSRDDRTLPSLLYTAVCNNANNVCLKICIHGYNIPYILESNPHPFYSFRGLKNQMLIRFAVVSRILKNERDAVRVVRTIQYNTIIYY